MNIRYDIKTTNGEEWDGVTIVIRLEVPVPTSNFRLRFGRLITTFLPFRSKIERNYRTFLHSLFALPFWYSFKAGVILHDQLKMKVSTFRRFDTTPNVLHTVLPTVTTIAPTASP